MKDAALKWLIGIGLGAVVTFLGLFTHYQIKSQVESQLSAAGIPSTSQIDLMQKDIEANAERAENNKENNDKLNDKIERIVGILLEE